MSTVLRRLGKWPFLTVAPLMSVQASAAQSATDSLAVIEVAVVQWITGYGFSHPAGRIETACVEPPTGFYHPYGDSRTPTLSPGQSAAVSHLLRSRAGVDTGQGCRMTEEVRRGRRWIVDDSGEPAVSFLVSAPFFVSPDTAEIHVGTLAGELWGGGIICRWVRADGTEGGWRLEERDSGLGPTTWCRQWNT